MPRRTTSTTPTGEPVPSLRDPARRWHLQRARAQHPPGLAARGRPRRRMPHPHQRPLPVRGWTRRPRRGHVPLLPRKSVVDIVQSVGGVMRKAPGKQYGYIILPVGFPAGMTPSRRCGTPRYAAVWGSPRLSAHRRTLQTPWSTGSSWSSSATTRSTSSASPGPTVGGQRRRLHRQPGHPRAGLPRRMALRRSTPKSSPRSAPGANGRTGPTSPTSPSGTSPASPPSRRWQHPRSPRSLTGSSPAYAATQRRHHRADAVDMLAQHLITRPVFEAPSAATTSPRTTPSPRPWNGCWSPSTSTTSTTRTTSESSTTRSACGCKVSTRPRGGRSSSSSSTTPSSPPP